VTITDITYQDTTLTTNTLATDLVLDSNGMASVTTSALTAGSHFLGNHWITALYNGSGTFPSVMATRIQKVHANATTTTLTTSTNGAAIGQSVTFTAQQQRLIYIAMTQITGTELQQILSLLRVTTAGLTTMADLLNPVKTFPRSYNTLTAPTANGLRGIYINSSGAVNTRLETELPASVLVPLTGNPLQNMTTQLT
jgi:hypothetical protein